jgi:hypothetical protein
MYLHNNLINFLYRKQDESIKAKQIKKFSYLNPSQSTPGSQDQVKMVLNLLKEELVVSETITKIHWTAGQRPFLQATPRGQVDQWGKRFPQ